MSSDDNARQLDFDLLKQPSLRELGLLAPAAGADRASVAAAAVAPDLQTVGDFFKEGRAARWVLAQASREQQGQQGQQGQQEQQGRSPVYWLARDERGRWLDRSAELQPDAHDRLACTSPRQALTADFNLDGRPDVYLACDGEQLLFLSQADGAYRRELTSLPWQTEGVRALDVDGDGLMDVVSVGSRGGVPMAFVLYGRGNGSFSVAPLDLLSPLLSGLLRSAFQRGGPSAAQGQE